MEKARNVVMLILTIVVMLSLAGAAGADVTVTYLYNLSDFGGAVSTTSARISIDNVNNEVYLISGDLIRVFNAVGMEIYHFGEDLDVGALYDAAVDEEGNIYVLSFTYGLKGPVITLCNFRGEPLKEVPITNVPADFKGFSPNRIIYRNGTLYLASDSAMKVIITDRNGVFKEGMDLFLLMDIKPEKSSRYGDEKSDQPKEISRYNYGIDGFNVDYDGNLLFTSPITATAYVISPNRKVESFGKRGSAPGRFAVPRGMARDRSGNFLVSDILRSVVMVFDKDFKFITEFGSRGFMPGNLIGPSAIEIDNDSKVYVTQLMERGVSVFKLGSN